MEVFIKEIGISMKNMEMAIILVVKEPSNKYIIMEFLSDNKLYLRNVEK
jgi:hypothetical protein